MGSWGESDWTKRDGGKVGEQWEEEGLKLVKYSLWRVDWPVCLIRQRGISAGQGKNSMTDCWTEYLLSSQTEEKSHSDCMAETLELLLAGWQEDWLSDGRGWLFPLSKPSVTTMLPAWALSH